MINGKFRPPPVAITRGMVESGLTVLAAMTAENDGAEHTDDALVANIFYCMWETYHREIAEMAAKKAGGLVMAKPPKLILPGTGGIQ